MPSLALFTVLLVLRMHACIAARPLGLTVMRNLLLHKEEEVQRLNAHDIASQPLNVMHWMKIVTSVTRVPETKDGGAIQDFTRINRLEAKKAKHSTENLRRKKLVFGAMAGNMITSTQPRAAMQAANDILGSQGISRSVLESDAHREDEPMGSFEPVEDIVVMDYAHPHKKPPIHNLTP